MKTLLIVYHSLTGGTHQMAKAAAMGAATEPGVDVRLLQASAAGTGDVLAADGYIFAAPENLAALAGLMKDFFDRCYYPVLGRILRAALRPPDMWWQRWHQRGPAGRSHCDRVAFAGRGRASHCLHACPDA